MARYLLDTNLLVYPHDAREPEKRETAQRLLHYLAATEDAVLPAQAVAEFANVMLGKFQPAFSPGRIRDQIERLHQAFSVLPLTPAIVLEAVRGVRDHQLAYYDAQIWAAARLNQVPVVLSEDFNDGATLDGVTFLNPLSGDVELDRL